MARNDYCQTCASHRYLCYSGKEAGHQINLNVVNDEDPKIGDAAISMKQWELESSFDGRATQMSKLYRDFSTKKLSPSMGRTKNMLALPLSVWRKFCAEGRRKS